MWFDLYLVCASLVAISAWLVSPHFQSYDPPTNSTRALWSVVAGVVWPLIVVGAVQVIAVRYVMRRLRPAKADGLDLTPQAELCEAGSRV
jgi:hypothetical protein